MAYKSCNKEQLFLSLGVVEMINFFLQYFLLLNVYVLFLKSHIISFITVKINVPARWQDHGRQNDIPSLAGVNHQRIPHRQLDDFPVK